MTMLEDIAISGIPISMIQFFESNLDNAKQKFAVSWTKATEINFQLAILYLYALCFLPDPQ
jgi:hypothetical protein